MLPRRVSGFALVSVLWLVVLLTVLATGLAYTSRQSIRSVGALVGGTQARYLADGGMQLILMNLLNADPADRVLGDGEALDIELPGGSVAVTVMDENGKIDINVARPELLARLFYSIDVPDEQAEALADAIVDFRDKDDLKSLHGAEDDDYLLAGLPWGAKDDKFTSLQELRRVFGMQAWIFNVIQPYVTIHSRQRGVNPEVAPLQILLAVSDESPSALATYIDQRRDSYNNGLPLPPSPVIERSLLSRTRGITYTLAATARTETGKVAGVTTTIRLRRGRQRMTVSTLDWKPYQVIPTMSTTTEFNAE